ncbi:MAG TPA: hypothetical protein VFS75_00920 [Candidatus Paceibacterota bacterium]|nr:hypothetical protein [Candidatus Paceibacterota bacterium]
MKFSFHKRGKKKPSFHLWKDGTSTYMNPSRDWTIGLVIASVGFVVGATLIGFDFYSQLRSEGADVPPQTSQMLYDQNGVTEYARIYSRREDAFNALRAGGTPAPVLTPVATTTATTTPLAGE